MNRLICRCSNHVSICVTLQVEDKQIIYKNTIMTRNISTNALINRQQSVHIDFSCLYNQPDIESMAITIKDGCVTDENDTVADVLYTPTPLLPRYVCSSQLCDAASHIWTMEL